MHSPILRHAYIGKAAACYHQHTECLSLNCPLQVGPGFVEAVQILLGLQTTGGHAAAVKAIGDAEKIPNAVSKTLQPHQPAPKLARPATSAAASAVQADSAVGGTSVLQASAAKAQAHASQQPLRHRHEAARPPLGSGDDLGGDFLGVDLLQDVLKEDAKGHKKKNKNKNKLQQQPDHDQVVGSKAGSHISRQQKIIAFC